jgi:hypothetical protein
MTVTVKELFGERTETKPGPTPSAPGVLFAPWKGQAQATVAYLVEGPTSEAAARAAVESQAPSLPDLGVELAETSITERIAATTWKVTGTYKERLRDNLDVDYAAIGTTFDSTGSFQHITQSRRTVSRTGGDGAPDMGGAIGYDGEYVQGVDIMVPAVTFTVTRSINWLDYGGTDADNLREIAALTGSVNAAAFLDWAAGELRFDGVTGTKGDNGWWDLSLRFSASPNRTGIAVGDLTVSEKRGWDYLWIRYGDDGKPVGAYVEEVYPHQSWHLLDWITRTDPFASD